MGILVLSLCADPWEGNHRWSFEPDAIVLSVLWTKAPWALRGNGALPSDGSLKSEVVSRGPTPFASQEEAGSWKCPPLVMLLSGRFMERYISSCPTCFEVGIFSFPSCAGVAQLVSESLSQRIVLCVAVDLVCLWELVIQVPPMWLLWTRTQ